jgi:antitoxin component HigA of HigAB toxin-antitoxin module
MKIKVLKNEAEYEAALAEIESMIDDAQFDKDQLELLALLVKDYEDKYYPVDLPDPVEAIKFRMEQMGLTRKNLEQYIGNKSKVSEVLSGKRRLSLSMIHALHQGLGIPAEVLLGKQDTAELDKTDVKSWFSDKLDRFSDDPEFQIEEMVLDFTEKLVAKMQEQKVSRAELAKRLDVSKTFITKLLNGNPNMTIKSMVAIATMLDCRLNLDIYNKESGWRGHQAAG